MKAFILLLIGFALIYGGISGKLAATFVKKTDSKTNEKTPPPPPPPYQ